MRSGHLRQWIFLSELNGTHGMRYTYLQCFQHGHRLQEGLVHLPLKKTNDKFLTQEEISFIPRLPQHLSFTWRVKSVHTASDQCSKSQETMLIRDPASYNGWL